MTIFSSAYKTTATNGFNLKKTEDAIAVAEISGELTYTPNFKVRAVQNESTVLNNIPTFEHPLVLKDSDKMTYVAVDIRQFGTVDRQTKQYRVRNTLDHDTAVLRAKLDYIWNTKEPKHLSELHPLPAVVFAAWLSESIGRKYYLDGEEQLRVAILAGYFYQCLFTNEVKFDEKEFQRVVGNVASTTSASAEDVFAILDNVPVLQNIDDFCKYCEIVTESVRLKELNPGVLITMMGGTWFAHNRVEVVGVALEHPPTWIAVLVACYKSRSYKSTTLGRLADSKNKGDVASGFQRAVFKKVIDSVDD